MKYLEVAHFFKKAPFYISIFMQMMKLHEALCFNISTLKVAVVITIRNPKISIMRNSYENADAPIWCMLPSRCFLVPPSPSFPGCLQASRSTFKKISWTYTCRYSIFELCVDYNLYLHNPSLYSCFRTYKLIILNHLQFALYMMSTDSLKN